ncbi:MAG: hypothetical protein VXZ73_02785 [Pseudomonadota bacterium]|nr:hypothetical protein [Pseudomonadota bacterium]
MSKETSSASLATIEEQIEQIDLIDGSITQLFNTCKDLCRMKIKPTVDEISGSNKLNINDTYMDELQSSVQILEQGLHELRLEKEITGTQLDRVLQSTSSVYEQGRAREIASRGFEKIRSAMIQLKNRVIQEKDIIEQDSKHLTKIWLERNIQASREQEMMKKRERVAYYIKKCRKDAGQWSGLLATVDRIHEKRSNIEDLMMTYKCTGDVHMLYSKIINDEISMLDNALSEAIRHLQIQNKKS